MRKLLLLSLMLTLVFSPAFAQGTAVISGKISKPLSDVVEVALRPNPLVPEELKLEATLEGNSFRVEVPVNQAVVAELLHGDEVVPVYLEPGYDLNLSASGGKFLKTLKYAGTGANENNYLAAYTLRFEEEEEYQALPDNIKQEEEEFLAFLDYRHNDQLESLEKYAAKNAVSERFKHMMLAEAEFSYANDVINYHPLRQRILQVTLTKPSAAFYTCLQKLNLQRPENLLSTSFHRFLQHYTTYLAQEAGFDEKHPRHYQSRYEAAAQKLQGQAKQLAQAQVLQQSIRKGHAKYTEQMLQDFLSQKPDPALTAYLNKLSNGKSSLSAGSQAPDFALASITGDSVRLSDFAGKLVYLNFWSSDCGLCLVELPALQQLTNKLKGHQAVVLNVAVGADEANWRKLVQEKELQGVQAYLPNGLEAKLATDYQLKELPAYFLIDGQGRFISVKARRPGHPEALNNILQHLKAAQASLK
ncbi:TlpA family protein disulfide reductase [Pontibacter mangrovi]|uniref:TlpA family protein disulfide reductase n=1 Tax=Pontibacter mangrovi TaxID=2589816 RepID=A0A501WAZ5_9BACT|nr:TlpA disulfide reductase family protein [Pontibacter mangrovi]TPE45530.1 TlpA family protein disulfide reductase [Pontibacter mangrovi]